MKENSSRSSAFQRTTANGERWQAKHGEARSQAAVPKTVGADVLTQRYTGTGIMLCPDKLAAYWPQAEWYREGLSSLYDGSFFVFPEYDRFWEISIGPRHEPKK